MSKVCVEDRTLASPEVGVARFEENAFAAGLAMRSYKAFVDRRNSMRHLYNLRCPNQGLQRQRFHAPCALDEMCRCIYVGARMRPKAKQRYVGGIAVSQRFPI